MWKKIYKKNPSYVKLKLTREEDFVIPSEKYYRFGPYESNIVNLDSNVNMGYNTSMITDDFRSKIERLFEKYCYKNSNIKYMNKDGDCVQQHFSIVYGTNFEKQWLFYPDYIIQLQNNTIWIIETKCGEKWIK